MDALCGIVCHAKGPKYGRACVRVFGHSGLCEFEAMPLITSVDLSQPPPITNTSSSPVAPIVDTLISTQRAKGLETYGTELMTNNGRNAPMDAAAEAFDFMNYAVQWHLEREELLEKLEARDAQILRLKHDMLKVQGLVKGAANYLRASNS